LSSLYDTKSVNHTPLVILAIIIASSWSPSKWKYILNSDDQCKSYMPCHIGNVSKFPMQKPLQPTPSHGLGNSFYKICVVNMHKLLAYYLASAHNLTHF